MSKGKFSTLTNFSLKLQLHDFKNQSKIKDNSLKFISFRALPDGDCLSSVSLTDIYLVRGFVAVGVHRKPLNVYKYIMIINQYT